MVRYKFTIYGLFSLPQVAGSIIGKDGQPCQIASALIPKGTGYFLTENPLYLLAFVRPITPFGMRAYTRKEIHNKKRSPPFGELREFSEEQPQNAVYFLLCHRAVETIRIIRRVLINEVDRAVGVRQDGDVRPVG